MQDVQFECWVEDKLCQVKITQPSGAGNLFFVFRDNYYICGLNKTESFGWQWHLPNNSSLQSGDLYAFIEIIEENWPAK